MYFLWLPSNHHQRAKLHFGNMWILKVFTLSFPKLVSDKFYYSENAKPFFHTQGMTLIAGTVRHDYVLGEPLRPLNSQRQTNSSIKDQKIRNRIRSTTIRSCLLSADWHIMLTTKEALLSSSDTDR